MVAEVDARLALDDLEQHGGGLLGRRRLERVEVVEGHVLEAVGHRREGRLELRLAGRGDRRERPAVERVLRR